MTDSKPASLTPTAHGQWRVIDGQLVDEAALPAADVLTEALDSAPAAAAGSAPSMRRKVPAKTE